jgi:hypothetical protein
MARFIQSIIALVLVIIFVSLNVESRPYADNTISGTILQPFGGALGGYAPSYSNYAAYNPYGYGFFG